MGLYTEKLLQHARAPQKFGRLAAAHIQFEEYNPLCGDRIRIELRLAGGGEILEARFSGEMCAVAKGSASILLQSIEGMQDVAVAEITDAAHLEELGGPVERGRLKCALLPVWALRGAIKSRGTQSS